MTSLPDKPGSATVLTRTEWFRNRFFKLVTDEIRLPSATGADDEGSVEHPSPTVRRDYVADHLGAVGVVAYDEHADAIVLVRQYRHPVGRQLWELPAGLLDIAGESALSCAKRELAEEADLVARRWDVLLDLLVTPGSSDEAIRIYLARDVAVLPETQRTVRIDEEATMVREWVPLDLAIAAVLGGKLENATCVAGVLALQHAKTARWPPLRAAGATWRARPGR